MKTYPSKAEAEKDLKLAQKIDPTAFPQRIRIADEFAWALRVGHDKWFAGEGQQATHQKLQEEPVATEKIACPVCGEDDGRHKPGCTAPRTKSGHADLDAIAKEKDRQAKREAANKAAQ